MILLIGHISMIRIGLVEKIYMSLDDNYSGTILNLSRDDMIQRCSLLQDKVEGYNI